MIFPDVSTKYWTQKYPALEEINIGCGGCGATFRLNIPALQKDWASLVAKDCSCGMKSPIISVPTTQISDNIMASLLGES